MALREPLKERASLNDFELHNSPIHELIQYSLERLESLRKRMEEAWTSGGALSAILSGVDEMTDGKGVIGWIVRRLYKGSLKKKPNAMRGAEIDERIIGDMEKYLRLSGAPTSDWFVYGHTHVPEGRKREGGFSIVNAGSWFKDPDTIHNTYVVIDDEVVI